jgi:exopolysaccharide production protein ExoQ
LLQRARSARPTASASLLDRYAMVPVAACAFALIVSPLLILLFPTDPQAMQSGAARIENRIFWPAATTASILLAAHAGPRLSRLTWPPHIIALATYLSLAAASATWAYVPEISLVRSSQQAMIIASIVLPALLAARTTDMIWGVYLCCAVSSLLNIPFVIEGYKTIVYENGSFVDIGFQGYFSGKNYLGECATVTLLMALHETSRSGWRRALGALIVVVAIVLLVLSKSKTALGLAILSPILSLIVLVLRIMMRTSVAAILASIPACVGVVSSLANVNIVNRLSFALYGDSTLTGRTLIWDFVDYKVTQRPLLGWGYKSFWLVPNSPSMDARSWVALMPNGHNGYYDTKLELGYVGLAVLLIFIVCTLHAVGRVADRDPARARLLLSLLLFIIMWNYFETLWMQGYDFLWVVFLLAAAEVGRYWRPDKLRVLGRRSGIPRLGSPARPYGQDCCSRQQEAPLSGER